MEGGGYSIYGIGVILIKSPKRDSVGLAYVVLKETLIRCISAGVCVRACTVSN